MNEKKSADMAEDLRYLLSFIKAVGLVLAFFAAVRVGVAIADEKWFNVGWHGIGLLASVHIAWSAHRKAARYDNVSVVIEFPHHVPMVTRSMR